MNLPIASTRITPAPHVVIFDLDGTLADTFPLIVAAWNAAVQEPLGRTYAPAEVIARFGIPDTAMLRRELPEAAWEQAVEVYHQHYETEHAMAAPFPGVPELLRALGRHRVPLGVMTGKGRRTAEITLRRLNWQGVFDSVVTGEDVANQKPAPDGILLAARQIGVEPEHCVYVGDSPGDIKAGKAAGMTTIVAAWHPVYLDRLQASEPDFWAVAPADIVALLGISNE